MNAMKMLCPLLLLVALAVGCTTDNVAREGQLPGYNQWNSDTTIQRTFDVLDKMKSDGLITPDEHGKLRELLVRRLEKGIPNASNYLGTMYSYFATRYDNLHSLARIKSQGQITQADYDRIKAGILDLAKAKPDDISP